MIRRAENLGQRRSEIDALTARLVSLRVGAGRYADARRLAERLLNGEATDDAHLSHRRLPGDLPQPAGAGASDGR